MTKEEVLQGALSLNENGKNYTVTVQDNKIIIRAEYKASLSRKGVFQCIAHLNDDNTYVETHKNSDGRHLEMGKVSYAQKRVTFTFGGKGEKVEVEKETFNSDEIKNILRDYLDRCGYKKTNKGFFKRLFRK